MCIAKYFVYWEMDEKSPAAVIEYEVANGTGATGCLSASA
jgi:hypothetical protein